MRYTNRRILYFIQPIASAYRLCDSILFSWQYCNASRYSCFTHLFFASFCRSIFWTLPPLCHEWFVVAEDNVRACDIMLRSSDACHL